MPNLLDIRRRIRSVKNTQQITRALKMISASKLRRAQEQALAARPYAERLREMLAHLAGQLAELQRREAEAGQAGPGLGRVPASLHRVQLIVISADTGRAGAFNANVIKAAQTFLAEPAPDGQPREVKLEIVGRKALESFRKRNAAIVGEHLGVFDRQVDYGVARALAAGAAQRFVAGEVDAVYIVGNEFKSIVQQRVSLQQLLPLAAPQDNAEPAAAVAPRDYLFEQPPAEIFAKLLPRYLEVQIYRSLLESLAAEHAARMNAMDNATRNAGDLIEVLTLNMNRVRQAAITKEIIEIVGGAAALTG